MKMEFELVQWASKKFIAEYINLKKSSPGTVKKINVLIADVLDHPRSGTGKPERLRHNVKEVWSRRIDKRNRLVYIITGRDVYFESCIGHYGDH
jgi:toxin YoeB